MRKVLITGAGGYIGGRLVRMLAGDGWDVRALGREPAHRLGVPETRCDLARPDRERLRSALAEVDVVVHLAGESEVLAAHEPAAAIAQTAVATENLAEACRKARVSRLVYLSTVHVYGARVVPGATLEEDMRPEPRSAYAISRLACEHIVAALAAGGYELVVLRLTNSVGAPDAPEVDRWSLVANDLCRQGAVAGELELRSSGTQWRDFVAMRSVCRSIARVASADDGEVPAGTYNLGSGRSIRVRELAVAIQDEFERQTGSRPPLRAPDPEPDAPGAYSVSIERAAEYGILFDDPLADAISETVRFCLDHREELR